MYLSQCGVTGSSSSPCSVQLQRRNILKNIDLDLYIDGCFLIFVFPKMLQVQDRGIGILVVLPLV